MWYVKTRLWYVILLKYLKKICAMVYDHSSKSDIYLSAPFRQFMPSPTYILFTIGLTLSAVSCWPKNYTLFLGIRQNFPSSWPAWFSQRNEFTVKSRFFKNLELYWSNLPHNSNFGRELVQKSGVQIPVGEGQIFLSHFLFIFIFSIKNWILPHKILFFLSSFTN